MRVLKAGGSAVDAAVAIQAVLGLVEPQSSGLGGGSFMVFYDAKTHKVTAYDGRETAPAGANPKQFLHPDGTPMSYAEAVMGGQSSGVPGAIAMLDMAQKDHGKLPWKALFAPAHELATDGFIVSPRLASMIVSRAPQAHGEDAMAYFRNADGSQMKAGDRLINKAYAGSLDLIAANRSAGLLSGPLAEAILQRIHTGPYPSPMTLADMAAYKPRKTEALCRPYRAYVICTPQAPRAVCRCRRRWASLHIPTSTSAAPRMKRAGICSRRPAASPMPTATSMRATPPSCPCPPRACWRPTTSPSAPR